MRRLLRRLVALFRWNARDREMEREMSFHVDALAREYRQAGLPPSEADQKARRQFGSLLRLKEEGHDVRTGRFLDGLGRDVRIGWRGLRRNPGFSLAVVLTFALGIGTNASIFSIVDQVLFRPLPFPAASELVVPHEQRLDGSAMSVSPANWMDWQHRSHTLSAIAVWGQTSVTLSGDGPPERLEGQLVSAEFFPLLGVRAADGRTVSVEDDRPDARRVVVLSHGLWLRRFGGDAAVVGRVVQVNELPAEIIGVMPAEFHVFSPDIEFWMALRLDRQRDWRATAGRFLQAIARRAPGVTLVTAQTELATISASLASEHEFNRGSKAVLVPLREELTGQVQGSLLLVAGAVGLLLAIACFNVASLLVARTATRAGELAIRVALGARRAVLVRQLLIEAMLLSSAGGVLGLALAHWTLGALLASVPAGVLPISDVSIDLRVLIFGFVLSVVTGLVVGLISSLQATRRRQGNELPVAGTRVTRGIRMRRLLVVGQMAMTMALLCGAGLLVRTVMALDRADTGFSGRNVLTMNVSLPTRRYDAPKRTAFFAQAIEALRALPSVESAGAGSSLPLVGGARASTGFHRQGTPQVSESDMPETVVRVAMPGYFRTLGIPIRRGREFTLQDEALTAQPGFLVNEAFVQAYLTDVDPLTVSLKVLMDDPNIYMPVIGVVGNTREGSMRAAPRPTVFYEHRQMPDTTMTIVVRADRPAALATSAVAVIHAIDPNLAVSKLRTFDDAMAEHIARDRLTAMVSGAFAASGLALASLGLYGLLTFTVTERRKEFGIRLALGAQVRRLTTSVVADGFAMIAVGAALGAAGALFLSRALEDLLFRVTPYDATTYVAVLGMLAIVGGGASYLAARQITHVQPVAALRQD